MGAVIIRCWIRRVMLVSTGVAALAGCASADGEETAQARDSVDGSGGGIRVINVEVTPIALTSFVEYIRITGEVNALYDVTVSAEESGVIARFYVDKGSRVRRGQAIAKIDDAVLRAQVAEARALAEIADEQHGRQRQLWEEEGIGSEITYLQAKSAAAAARARLELLQARLARTVVRAPVTGIFEEKYVEAGEMTSPGTPVARIVSVDQVKIVGGVPERYSQSVHTGDSAVVTLDVLPDSELLGRISFVGATVDAGSRTVPIEIVLANPDGALKPSMVASVRVERTRLGDVVVISQDVVVRTEDGYEVFLIGGEPDRPLAVARRVRLGPSHENRVVITEGLTEGELLITVGHRLVDDQSRVRVVDGVGGGGGGGR